MEVVQSRLEGALLLVPDVYRDERGLFTETYRRSSFAEIGVAEEMVQTNHSRSSRGVVRGMHFMAGPGISKLIRCVSGAIFDVVVDIRKGSPTFGQWQGFELTGENLHQVYCPSGFAHGFCVTSEVADVTYAQSGYYDPDLDLSFAHDDPEVGIEWPSGLELQVSPRDGDAPPLSALTGSLPAYGA